MQARLTILREPSSPAADPEALALAALGWVLGGETRADRLLSLTGLTPERLRAGLGERATLAAVLDFLCGHEPDLLAAADAIGIEPAELVSARERLE
ncbi:MAG: DUF3572 domain-containing protein [Novosphingobium sp.]|nr:DUF3572 domain-containing protein [Novosphingobium sp.]